MNEPNPTREHLIARVAELEALVVTHRNEAASAYAGTAVLLDKHAVAQARIRELETELARVAPLLAAHGLGGYRMETSKTV